MPLTDLVAPNAVVPALKVNGKKQAIQELSRAAKLTGQNERLIFETLMQREKLGSTGVGNGIAIPHGKLPKLEKLVGLFARLDRPIDFESLDGQPVDLIFLLLAPEGAGADHLKALARVARLLREPEVVDAVARVARCRCALRGARHAALGSRLSSQLSSRPSAKRESRDPSRRSSASLALRGTWIPDRALRRVRDDRGGLRCFVPWHVPPLLRLCW